MDTEVERVTSDYASIHELIADETSKRNDDRSFYVANMQDVYKKHMTWTTLLPRIKPYYAVKCNNLPEVVAFLARLGTGFDCASKQEIDQILALGVDPSNMIYANPCKTPTFLQHAMNVGLNKVTFDNELELRKIASLHPNAELVLRIKGDERHSQIKLNMKFGASMDDCKMLLELASDLKLRVIGVSFHNGSNCGDANAYLYSIAQAKEVFEIGEKLGHSMHLLDIGGGFPGYNKKGGLKFEQYASVIQQAIDKHFPEVDSMTGEPTKYQIISEPGRYYVSSAFSLVAMVIAKRVEFDEKLGRNVYSYYLNDGVYGGFTNTLLDGELAIPQMVTSQSSLVLSSSYSSVKNNVNGRSRASSMSGKKQVNGKSSSPASAANGTAAYPASSNNNNNCISRNQEPLPLVNGNNASLQLHPTILWGPTCDSMDCIRRDFMFQELEVGQWLSFKNMGAYTVCVASSFNGFERASVVVAV